MKKTPTTPEPRAREATVPAEGALGLLALGYRGLEVWREARGTAWIEHRRREWEAARVAEAGDDRENRE